jgi:O-acetylserine/cysteine efflux transporter
MGHTLSWRDVGLIFVVLIIWGTALPVAKMMFTELSPLLALSFRSCLMALAALFFIRSWPSKRILKYLCLFVISSTYIHLTLMWIALEHIDASTFTLLQQSGTLFSVLIGVFVLKEILNIQTMIGMVISIIGLMIIFGTPNLQGQGFNIALIIISSFFGAVATLTLKKMGKVDIPHLIFYPNALGVPIILALSLWLEDNHIKQMMEADWIKLSVILIYQILFLNLAFVIWQRLLTRNDMIKVTPFLLLYPVFGVIFGILLLHEPLTTQLIAGGLFVLGGAGLMTLKSKQKSVKNQDSEIYIENKP